MLQTSLVVELLRSQPRLTFWVAAVAQTAMWWIIPSVFYSSPPGDLPIVLAVGHEFQLGSVFGPPLAFWAAEIAFDIAGSVGVYLAAQACVLFTYYAVFTLARAIVGIHHAAFAVLLMVGISAFTAPTPNFGPSVLAMPLSAFALLNLWRALGERRRASWFLLALCIGLLLLTTYAGLILAGLIVVFLATTRRGRNALRSGDPWLAGMAMAVVLFPHLIWLDLAGSTSSFDWPRLAQPRPAETFFAGWRDQFEALFLVHAGLLVLVGLGSKWHLRNADKVPVFLRSFTDPFGRRFVYFFAVAPMLVAMATAIMLDQRQPIGGYAPHLVLSGLAIIVLAGNSIPWHRPRLVAMAWSLLLLVPPLSASAAIGVLPWIGISGVDVTRPASAMGRFFANSFERRIGAPLGVVAGDTRTAALVALGAPTRPSLFIDVAPERSPWVSGTDIGRRGAVVVWSETSTRSAVPADIAARFPGLVAEVPRAFERMVQGRVQPLRIGWGVVRPQPASPAR